MILSSPTHTKQRKAKFYHYYVNTNSCTESFVVTEKNSHLVFEFILRNLWTNNNDILKMIYQRYACNLVDRLREMFFSDYINNEEKIHAFQTKLRNIALKFDLGNCKEKKTLELMISEYDSCKEKHVRVFNDIKKVLEDAGRYPCVYIYGAGYIAKFVASLAKRINLQVRAFVVSSNQHNKQQYLGLPVVFIDDISTNNDNNAFVLALDEGYHPSVISILSNFGHKNIFMFRTEPVF